MYRNHKWFECFLVKKTQNTHNHLCCRQSTLPSGQIRCYIQYELHISVLWSESWQRFMPPHAATTLAVVTCPWRKLLVNSNLGQTAVLEPLKDKREKISTAFILDLQWKCNVLTPGFAPQGIKQVGYNRLKQVRAHLLPKQKQLLAS